MFLRISKIFYILLVIYYGWFQYVFYQISNILLVLGTGMIVFIIIDAMSTKTNIFKSLPIELKLWFLFAFTSFFFGLIVAINYEYLISSILTFVQFLILIFGIIYISNKDKNIYFFIKFFIIFSFIIAMNTIFWGFNYKLGRISLGLSNNPNLLGIIIVIGIWCILYTLDLKKLLYSIFGLGAILMLVYVIVLTGSRKSFISSLLLILYWLLFIALKDIKTFKFKAKIKSIISLLLLFGAGYYLFSQIFIDSLISIRLIDLFKSGIGIRGEMYITAFDLFKESPFIGIGFDNYRAVSVYGTYSHSVFAEALACTGIVGIILYFSPYIIITKNYIEIVKIRKLDNLLLKKSKLMIGLFGVLLFLGTGVIHFYEMTSTIAFGMIIAFYTINNEKILKVERVKS